MELTAAVIRREAEAYREEQPLFPVEQEQIEGLPRAFRTGSFGWRDAEWVLRWYYRRQLGDIPHQPRRAAESSFDENDYTAVQSAIGAVHEVDTDRDRIDALAALSGVSIPVASGFLMFIDPAEYISFGAREWRALVRTGERAEGYPADPTVEDVVEYFETCRAISSRTGCSLWSLYRTLWQIGTATGTERRGAGDR